MTSTTVWILLTVSLLLLCSYLLQGCTQVEGFTAGAYTTADLKINTCPPYATEIQTAKGNTDCCQGDMVDGKCNATTFCTKSPAYESVKACLDVWREYFTKKGNDLCPATMRNYYEDITKVGSEKGCSAGAILEDGTLPAEPTKPKCKIYQSEEDNRTMKDSCYLEKERLKITCPYVNGQSPPTELQVNRATQRFEMFFCQYPFEPEIPNLCYDQTTLFSYMDKTRPSWRTSSFQGVNDQTCANYIVRRQNALLEKQRREEERRKREEAERRLRDLQNRWNNLFARFRRSSQDQSRLQQQLDEANRKAQECKR